MIDLSNHQDLSKENLLVFTLTLFFNYKHLMQYKPYF